MKKRIHKFLLVAATMLLAHQGAYAFDAKVDGAYYNLNDEDKTASVTCMAADYNRGAYIGDVEIPASITYSGSTYAVTSVDGGAFQDCLELTSLVLPASVTTIGSFAFQECSALKELTLPPSITLIDFGAFYGCISLTSVVVPSAVTDIETYAFYGCTALTSVELPASLKNLGSGAFYGCTSLQRVVCHSTTPPMCFGDGVFTDVPLSTCVLQVPYGAKEAYSQAPVWQDFGQIEEDVTGIRGVLTHGTSGVSACYSVDGRRLPQLQRGVNVVRYSDGTTRKVFVK